MIVGARQLAGSVLLSVLAAGCAQPGPFAETARPPPGAATPLEEGTLALRAGDPELAYRHFIRAITTGDRHAEALTGAGLALEAQGQLTRAREYFERARDLAPGSAIVHNNLGVVLYRLGLYREARRAFRTAFAVSSGGDAIARQNLAMVERTLAERDADEIQVATHQVVRTGSSEYRLLAVAEDGGAASAAAHSGAASPAGTWTSAAAGTAGGVPDTGDGPGPDMPADGAERPLAAAPQDPWAEASEGAGTAPAAPLTDTPLPADAPTDAETPPATETGLLAASDAGEDAAAAAPTAPLPGTP